MRCGVKSCKTTDDHFLWKCEFCDRAYHAACIGVQRHQENFITAFMVPLCANCQEHLNAGIDTRKLLHQQKDLIETIQQQTDAYHQVVANLKKMSLVCDLFENIENVLKQAQHSLVTNSTKCDSIHSELGRHMQACEKMLSQAITSINDANSIRAQKMDNQLLGLKHDLAQLATSPLSVPSLAAPTNSGKLEEILEEVRSISAAVSVINSITAENSSPQTNKTLAEELAELPPQQPEPEPPSDDKSGWRMLGNKRCWRQDWSAYDMKLNRRKLQEKVAGKARQRRKRRKQLISRVSSQQSASSTRSNRLLERSRTLGLDKELLALAKVQFSSPPSITDHPISGLSVPKFINFKKGETINPYRPEKQSQYLNNNAQLMENATPPLLYNNHQQPQPTTQHQQQQQQQQRQQQQQQQPIQPMSSSESQFELDPLRPPIVRLTEQSTEGDGRFLKARLRDPKIMDIVRLFLAYMHDQQANVCVNGFTATSIRLKLASEGLPSDYAHLLRIFKEVHQEYGLDPMAAVTDLESYRKYLTSERIHRLQQLRESGAKYQQVPSFRK